MGFCNPKYSIFTAKCLIWKETLETGFLETGLLKFMPQSEPTGT